MTGSAKGDEMAAIPPVLATRARTWLPAFSKPWESAWLTTCKWLAAEEIAAIHSAFKGRIVWLILLSFVCAAIKLLRNNKSTAHIPVIAFAAEEALHKEAAAAGATLAVGDAAILQHLNQLIDQALTEF